jgi:two-component system response regulator GlrR
MAASNGRHDEVAMKRRILIVDDDPHLLRLLGLRLVNEGHQVTEATSAERALAHLGAELPELVITDMKVSGVDGTQLCERLQREHPSLPMIILAARGAIPDVSAATRRGVVGYLAKPFEAKDLMREVERALALAEPAAGAGSAWRREIVTRSAAMEGLLAHARLVAESDTSVLVQGASGTGKALLARAIHAASARYGRPLVAVNCGALPDQLLESELFGHVKGAFPGAMREHKGLFQSAQGGTLYLDEISDIPLALQAKLLRALHERQVRPVGATQSVAVDVRVISATHRNLREEIAAGRFREDLYYRLNAVTLQVPGLAERREDIPLLVVHFLARFAERFGKPIAGCAPEALQRLLTAPWPGNVRQLRNVIEKCVALSTGPRLTGALVARALTAPGEDFAAFDQARRQFELEYLTRILRITDGNAAQAAKLAKRNRNDFYALLARHQLEPADFKPGKE